MKESKNFSHTFGVVLILMIGMQSCSVGGLLVGSIADSTDHYNYDIPVKSSEGWVVPGNKNHESIILLTNGRSLEGTYINTEYGKVEKNDIEFILIKSKSGVRRIPVSMIAYTNHFKVNKNHTKDGLIVGKAIDAFIIFVLLSVNDPYFNPFY